MKDLKDRGELIAALAAHVERWTDPDMHGPCYWEDRMRDVFGRMAFVDYDALYDLIEDITAGVRDRVEEALEVAE